MGQGYVYTVLHLLFFSQYSVNVWGQRRPVAGVLQVNVLFLVWYKISAANQGVTELMYPHIITDVGF